ncbi:MAG: signal peptidase I [Anaerolinea sp.]|nr:signal peptidase I [Anaerolinea sp.]
MPRERLRRPYSGCLRLRPCPPAWNDWHGHGGDAHPPRRARLVRGPAALLRTDAQRGHLAMTAESQLSETQKPHEGNPMVAIPVMEHSTVPVRPAMRFLRVGGSLLGGIFFGLAMGAAVLLFVATRFLGYEILTVQTGSMKPTLDPGDVVIIRPTSASDIKEQDIILFDSGKDRVPVVHRVVAIRRFVTNLNDAETGELVRTDTRVEYITKGDAMLEADQAPAAAAAVHGKVWFTVPRIGRATELPLQGALLLFAGLIGVAWVSYEVYRRTGKTRAPGGGQG